MQLVSCDLQAQNTTNYKLQYTLHSCCHHFIMESLVPLINISIAANDGEVNKAPCELLDLRLVLVNANKTLPVS